MKLLLTFLTLVLSTSGFAHAETDEGNIQKLIDRYETALNASNTEDVLKLYGQSPIFMPQNAPAQVGRAPIKAAYDNVFKTIKLDVKFTTHEVEIIGYTAWARTTSSGKTRIIANNAVVTEGNNELFIFKKEDGHWKIHRYLFSTNQPRN